MATVSVTFSKPHFVGQAAAAVLSSDSIHESITSSGSNQVSSNTSRADDVVRVASVGGAVVVAVGLAPDASVGGFVLPDGAVEYIGVGAGMAVAVVDV